MKKYLIALLFLLATGTAHAQFVTVSGQVMDVNGSVYSSCIYSVTFVPSPTATQIPTLGSNGQTFQTQFAGASCDTQGNFSIALADNNLVTDGHTGAQGSQWIFKFSTATGAYVPQLSFTYTGTITGVGMNLTSQLQSVAAIIPQPNAPTPTIAIKPKTSDAIQYVTPNGNDANDGLSMGTAKVTVNAAVTALCPANVLQQFNTDQSFGTIFVTGSFTYNADWGLQCPLNLIGLSAHINYTGSGSAIVLGPSGLTISTPHLGLYKVAGFSFTGGASATYGIRARPYVVQVVTEENKFSAYGSSSTIDFHLDTPNWEVVSLNDEIWTCGNGYKVESDPNTHVKIINPTFHGCSGYGVWLDGNSSEIIGGKIEANLPDVIMGATANGFAEALIGVYMEYFGNVGCIEYGSSAGNYLTNATIIGNRCNLHFGDFGETGSFLAPMAAQAGIQYSNIWSNRAENMASPGTAYLVKQNVLGSQIGNNISGNTINDVTLAGPANMHSCAAATCGVWFGSDGDSSVQNGILAAIATKSSAYTLTQDDHWVNVTGTTTITIPHNLPGQIWHVQNTGTAAVTLSPDSGSLSGASMIGPGIGAEITCDGTNCQSSAQYPQEIAEVNLTSQAANINATTLYAVPSSGAGIYRISCYVALTQAATMSSTLPSCEVGWTDSDSGSVVSVFPITNTSTSNISGTIAPEISSSGMWMSGAVFNAKASTNIQYATASYASSGATPMQYAIHIRLEYLGP